MRGVRRENRVHTVIFSRQIFNVNFVDLPARRHRPRIADETEKPTSARI